MYECLPKLHIRFKNKFILLTGRKNYILELLTFSKRPSLHQEKCVARKFANSRDPGTNDIILTNIFPVRGLNAGPQASVRFSTWQPGLQLEKVASSLSSLCVKYSIACAAFDSFLKKIGTRHLVVHSLNRLASTLRQ